MLAASAGRSAKGSGARSRARRCSLQALYQWQLGGGNVRDIEAQFLISQDMAKVDVDYFHVLLHGIAACASELDEQLAPFLDRPLDQVDPVERAALRIGVYELRFRPDVPYRVAINEAVELAKLFGAEQGHRFVNGVLDKVARVLRAPETGPGT